VAVGRDDCLAYRHGRTPLDGAGPPAPGGGRPPGRRCSRATPGGTVRAAMGGRSQGGRAAADKRRERGSTAPAKEWTRVDTSEYLGLFLDESRESLQALNASLLDLERDPADADALAVIFRVAHSLKGMSATMGFEAMARLTHRMETVLASLRDGEAAVTPAISDALFACLDTLQEMVDRIAAGDGGEADASALLGRLDAIAGGTAAPAVARAQTAATLAPQVADETLSDYDRVLVADAHEHGMVVMRVGVTFDEGCQLRAARAFMVAQALEAVGDLIRSEPPTDEIEAGGIGDGVTFWVTAASPSQGEEIRARVMDVSEVAACGVDEVTVPGRAGDGGRGP
jgi:two-component system, chemotaxis family, sensor kinase CheA